MNKRNIYLAAITLFLLWLLSTTGCGDPWATPPGVVKRTNYIDIGVASSDVYELEIEGCQYLVTRGYQGSISLCHKGNCKNHE